MESLMRSLRATRSVSVRAALAALLAVGLLTLLAYVALAKRYWFSIPYRGIVAATILYAAALLNIVI